MIEQKLLEVEQFINGDYFGQESVIDKVEIEYSVITSVPTELYVLDEYELQKLYPSIPHIKTCLMS